MCLPTWHPARRCSTRLHSQQIKMRLDQLKGDAARQIKLIAPALDAAREIKIDNLATQFEAMHWGEASSRHDYTEDPELLHASAGPLHKL